MKKERKEHLSINVLEDAVERLSSKLSEIKKATLIDIGQEKAPTKRDYKNAMLAIQRIIET